MNKNKNIIETMIMSARNNLLDTSFNNRMINSKITLNKGLSFSVEDLTNFYKLVTTNNSFSFLPLENKASNAKSLISKSDLTTVKTNDPIGSVSTVTILSSTNNPSLLQVKFTIAEGDSQLVYKNEKETAYFSMIEGFYNQIKKNFTKYSILQDNIYNKNLLFTGFKRHIEEDVESTNIATYLSILSVLRQEGIPKDHIFIGGINSKKEITSVKNAESKVVFAYKKGCSKVFISKRNKKDLKNLSPEIINNLEIIYLSNVDEAIISVFNMVNEIEYNTSEGEFVASARNKPKKVFYVNYNRDDLRLRTEKIYYNSKRHIEEQGVNILFLSFGFIQWKHPQNEDELINSPLIFIPVQIESTNYKSLYEISYSNSDILINKSLLKKLELEFNINFDSLVLDVADELEFNPLDFLNQFSNIVNESGYDFGFDYHSVHLSFYSYNKFLIYNDLDPVNWKEALEGNHKNVLNDIFVNNIYQEVSNIDDDKIIDNTREIDNINNILDADSSQLLAISKVSRGNSIIIQGPPGTGKSQTIVNIIAEAVRQNKKVLFMSEKLAAMEVVYKRLKAINLDHIALQLHSDKINKTQVVKEIQSVYYMNKINVKNSDSRIVEKLASLRNEINQYYNLINTSALHSSFNLIQCYQRIIELENYFDELDVKHYELEIPNSTLMEMDDFQFEELYKRLGILENFNKKYGKLSVSPLQSVYLDKTLNHHELLKYTELINDLMTHMKEINKALAYPKLLSLKKDQLTFKDIKQLIALREIDDTVLDFIKNVNHTKMVEKKSLLDELFTYYNLSKTNSKLINLAIIEETNHLDHLESLKEELNGIISTFEKNKSLFKCKSKLFKEYKARVLSKFFIQENNSFNDIVKAIVWLQNRVSFKLLVLKETVVLEKVFGKSFDAEKADFQFLFAVYNNVEEIYNSMNKIFFNKDIKKGSYIDFFKKIIKEDFRAISEVENIVKSLTSGLKLDEEILYENKGFCDIPLNIIQVKFKSIHDNLIFVNEIIVQKRVKTRLELDIEDDYLCNIISEESYASHISKVFAYIRYHSIVKEILDKHNVLDEFNSLIFDQKIREFVELDSKNIQLNNLQLILDAHFYKVYNIRKDETLSVEKKDERISYLLQTFNKKHNIPSVKQLLNVAFEPITELKPVFMMSPISISQYLEPVVGMFDIVVFDESSQIKPQDAFGALLRGKQIVVVGDEKQLPPTNFFESYYGNTDLFEEDAISNFESILTLMRGRGVPTTTLNWHYRSKHHNLISISNDYFYENKMSIFPSKYRNNPDYGLKFIYCDGVFDRGRSRTNRKEATIIADQVVEHAKTHPTLSLGVATLNINQRDLILSEIKKRRSKEPALDAFFNEENNEAFFVKNLENVQGDEREVIFISIGYTKDQNGNIIQNFGAINHQGGERRLNVLMTRARQKCVIFSGLRASDLEIDYNTTEGVKVLRKFLDYAESNNSVQETDIVSDTLVFSQEIAEELHNKGYKTSFNVGNDKYFIDLAVYNPKDDTEYLLGIEFDNSTYHQSRTASERERIRNSVMRSKGWVIYKVFITSWFNNRTQVIDDILDYLKHIETKSIVSEKQKVEFIEENVNVVTRFGFRKYKKYSKMIENINFLMKEGEEFKTYVHDLVYKEMPITFQEISNRIIENSHLKVKDKTVKKALKKVLSELNHDRSIYLKEQFYYFHKKEQNIEFRDRRDIFEIITLSDIPIEETTNAIIEIARNSFGINSNNIASIISNYLGHEVVSDNLKDVIERLLIRLENTNIVKRDSNNNIQIRK
jgi:superfamily I DNA and/or RNA helicase